MKEVAMKIKLRRISLNLSQDELAEIVDMSQQKISMIERGAVDITITDLRKIAKALKIKTSLFFDDEQNSQTA